MTWLSSNWALIGQLTLAHLWIALPVIALSVALSVPVARWAAFSRRGGWVLSALSALYAVPSLPLLVVIPVIIGVALRSNANMIAVLTLYGVAVLVRQVAEGFRTIPRATLQAANACGYSLPRRFVEVELPLATPVIVAGTRVVATSTVSLVTVGAFIGVRSLGTLFTDGFQHHRRGRGWLGRDGSPGARGGRGRAGDRLGTDPVGPSGARMSIFLEALSWLTTPANWLGESGILTRSAEHLGLTFLIVVLASLVALPLGTVIGHTGRGRWLVSATGAARAVPTLGVLTLAGLWLGIGLAAPTLALLVLAIPPLLSATYSGIASTPHPTVDAARAIGLTEPQILAQVEFPHAAGLIAAGVRSATLQVIATTTLAAYTANYGLGRFLYAGLKTRDYAQMIGGAIVVVALALATDALLALIARRLRTRTHSFADEEKNSLKESL